MRFILEFVDDVKNIRCGIWYVDRYRFWVDEKEGKYLLVFFKRHDHDGRSVVLDTSFTYEVNFFESKTDLRKFIAAFVGEKKGHTLKIENGDKDFWEIEITKETSKKDLEG